MGQHNPPISKFKNAVADKIGTDFVTVYTSPESFSLTNVSCLGSTIAVTCDSTSGLEEGDLVNLSDNTSYNERRVIKVVDATTFLIDNKFSTDDISGETLNVKGKTAILIELDLSNITGTDAPPTVPTGIQVNVVLYDSSLDKEVYIVKSAPIPVGSTLQAVYGQKIVLESGDYIKVNSTLSESVDVIASIIENVNS